MMSYNRTIKSDFAGLIENNGKLRWLFDFVKNNKELDFLIGKNNSKEWISVYRGLTRILSILPDDDSTIVIEADNKYKNLLPNLFGKRSINDKFENEIVELINRIENYKKFDRYYKNKKEGYFQNELSRMFGIYGTRNPDFVIIDKEVVIGYKNQSEKDILFGNLQEKYKQLLKDISEHNAKRYGKNLEKKAIGNELDFLALDKNGNILLIEYKHGTNTSGIYLSPLQIGLYCDIFTDFPKYELIDSVFQMLEQKQKIGLINPEWNKPNSVNGIIPVLIISEYNYKSSAKLKFNEIMNLCREKLGADFLRNIRTYNFTVKKGLTAW